MRADIPTGDVTYNTIKTVQPFDNVICVLNVSGQTVLDALEWTSMNAGLYNADGSLSENGGFLQVSGLTYDIDASIPSSCTYNSSLIWTGGPTGSYKVSNVKVYNKETGIYEPLEPDKTYRVGGLNYILRNSGNGCAMFNDSELVLDYIAEDYICDAEYAMSFKKGEDGMPHISTENSPMLKYPGFMINYEEPTGAGRIRILNSSAG